MAITEIRDPDSARHYILQGLFATVLQPLNPDTVRAPLEWMLLMASADEPLLPAGMLADVGRLIVGDSNRDPQDPPADAPLFHHEVLRSYEDLVLGKLYADATFERGSMAVCRMADTDQPRGIAWLISRLADRAGAIGVRCSPGILRNLQQYTGAQLLEEATGAIQRPLHPLLEQHYTELATGFRQLGDVLGAEDVFELEHGTCLVEFGQRLALRQVLRLSDVYERDLSPQPPRESGRARNIVTRLREEDSYPVGGFTSLSTRGTIESLLHSQLAYMEPANDSTEFDMFDVKFLRNELLYYSRDENEFLRRRREFVFVLPRDLQAIRVKDSGADYQRIIIVLATLLSCVRRLIEWLGDEALHFQFCFVAENGLTPLQDELELCRLLLREQIQNGTVSVRETTESELNESLAEHSHSRLTHCVTISTTPGGCEIANVLQTTLNARQEPQLIVDGQIVESVDALSWDMLPARLLEQLV